jgi:geranylgeranyl diphosphate synthase type II
LNLVGDAAKYGKELQGDIFEGKRTLILIHLLERASPEEREELRQILAPERSARTTVDVEWVRSRIDVYGCIDYARQVAHGLAGAAKHEFRTAFGDLPDSRDRRFLEALPAWVIERA